MCGAPLLAQRLCIVLGPLAIGLSALAMKRKEPQAALAMGLSVAGMVLGFIFGAIALRA